jgi:hypothetical protein
MLSECARATLLEETRFRVDYPNSAPRRIKIIALDAPADAVVRRLAQNPWNAASFMTRASAGQSQTSQGFGDWLKTLGGEAVNLLDQVGAADLVATVSTAGADAEDVAVVAEACRQHGITLTALVIDAAAISEPLLLKTMTPLRAHAAMLVVAKGEDYVETMLTALRA